MGSKDLISRCKKNERKAQEELYKLYSPKLFGVCLKYSENFQQAEDNLQDGFMTIFEKIGQYQAKGSFEGWMKRILINTALQKHRQLKVYRISSEEDIEEEEPEVDTNDISADFLLQCVQELPHRYRQVFNLYVLDGHTHKEISELLNISLGTSKSNLARARHSLREKIELLKHRNTVKSS